MSHPVLAALKTGRQVLATLGLLGATFGLPMLMAGGVGYVPGPTVEVGDWEGTGQDDPIVYIGLTDDAKSGSDDRDEDGGEAVAERDTRPGRTPARPKGGAQDTSDDDGLVDMEPTSTETMAAHARAATTGTGRRVPDLSHKKALRAQRAQSRGRQCATPLDGITQAYGSRYRVERQVIDHFSSNLDEAMGLARVSWHRDGDGDVDGFRLTRVRCGTPLTQVGFRSGDVIHTINGRKVRTLPQAFAAVRKVKRHDVITVELSRGGERIKTTVMVI